MFLILLIFVSSFAEAVSLSLVFPFLSAIANPNSLTSFSFFEKFQNINISFLSNFAGIVKFTENNPQANILFFTIVFIFAIMVSGTIKIGLVWFGNRFVGALGSDLGNDCYRRCLFQPYLFHIKTNSSYFISKITENSRLLASTINNWIILLSSTMTVLFILLGLFIINFNATFFIFIGLALLYFIFAYYTKKRVTSFGLILTSEHNKSIKLLQEGLGAIRDIILDKSQKLFYDEFKICNTRLMRSRANIAIIAQSPKYLMETAGMLIFSLIAFLFSKNQAEFASVLPILGVMALGLQKLLPAVQQGFAAWSGICAYRSANLEVIKILQKNAPKDKDLKPKDKLSFKKNIVFQNVSFSYSKRKPLVIKRLSLTIKKNSRFGIYGSSGSGKSTFLDLLMHLINPCSGTIKIDGKKITKQNVQAWQQNIAHVPQTIYLIDSTFAENIAFGVPLKLIDFDRVRNAARQAQIADFIESLPDGYNSKIGERGIFLSGGQRQRLGIARAFYKETELLILDEATNALDEKTESKILSPLFHKTKNLTIIIISHKKSSLKLCDSIYEIKKVMPVRL